MIGKTIAVIIAILSVVPFAQAQHRVDKTALQQLVSICKDTHSSGLSIWLDGKPYKDYVFDDSNANTPAFSAQKSLISLAIGKLVTDGRLGGIDTPVCHYYPEWKQGLKKTITIRHLLNHTSAIEFAESDPDGWDPANVIQYALSADIVDTPGNYFLYNDKAVNLLRGIIEKLSGQRMDKYIAAEIFKPLGIIAYSWEYDKTGTPVNLVISPAEFIKLGQLVLDNGMWNGRQIISAAWINQSMQQAQPFVPNCGLLWWRIPESVIYVVDDELVAEMKAAGVSAAFLEKFATLKGEYRDVNIPTDKLVAVFGKDWNAVLDKELYPHYPRRAKWGFSEAYTGYKAEGWLGQYLIIYPGKKLVACRMVKQGPAYQQGKDELRDFEKMVYGLVKH